jgi:phage tail sheath protein FI
MTVLSNTTPGVFVTESAANGPITGVGTSTTAFIGAAQDGPLLRPTLVTNWTQFKQLFGDYLALQRDAHQLFLAYAVKGFFDNGGTTAYIVRVGTAQAAGLSLADQGSPAGTALTVSALEPGTAGDSVTVAVAESHIVGSAQGAVVTQASAPAVSAAGDTIVLQNFIDAASFVPGDTVTLEGTSERAVIALIDGTSLLLATNLTAAHGAGTVRIADLAAGQTQFRVTNGAGLEPGSVIQLATGSTSEYQVIAAVGGDFVTLPPPGLTHAYSLDATGSAAAATTVISSEFSLTVTSPPQLPENWTNLSMDPRHSRYWGAQVRSAYVGLGLPAAPSVQEPPLNQPAALPATQLTKGTADDLSKIGLAQYQAALDALVPLQDVQLVCAPDRTDLAVQQAVVAHCESLRDRFAILQAGTGKNTKDGLANVPVLTQQRAWCQSERGYAALYYPWIQISDPGSLTGSGTLTVPPCGHIAGIYARSDANGVQNSPANLSVVGAVGLDVNVDSTTQGVLNVAGINVLRVFPGQGLPLVWGARTTAPTAQATWTYINVRRTFIYVESSLKLGLQPFVFQPNDTGLWKRMYRTIDDFLNRVWKSGALFGAKAAEAYYIQIDDENNPSTSRALGQVNITIGMAPVDPAEFVDVSIGLWDGGATVTEQ